ncbi:hypothetical protein Anas_13708 [Armadillidium nasatum]|uniref:Uncharacterized protein n=1 Tax=Armadillidium nasatum TaxID=96803 RepID=A0A5N5T731_9CRUS|nr:hypothetical protein Anas_13708 [Armadillidium nasatum]
MNSQDDSQVPVFTLSSPPKRRVPIMSFEQIFEHLTKELTRFWEKTRIITAEVIYSQSKEQVELSYRRFKHYQNGLRFNNQIYKRFFEESEEDDHWDFIEVFYYLNDFQTKQIYLLEIYIKVLGKIEEKIALEEARIRISNEIQRSIRSFIFNRESAVTLVISLDLPHSETSIDAFYMGMGQRQKVKEFSTHKISTYRINFRQLLYY